MQKHANRKTNITVFMIYFTEKHLKNKYNVNLCVRTKQFFLMLIIFFVLLQGKTLSAKQIELLANESLAKMKNTYASVKSVGKTITIDLTVDKITREVQINGNL